MEPIEIGLWVTGGLLAMVVWVCGWPLPPGLAGLVGLVWIFWAKFGYDPERFGKALTSGGQDRGAGAAFQGRPARRSA